MAFPNVSDIIATTIESRTKKIADNVTDNNALLKKMSMAGRIKTISGGSKIFEELSFAENSNAGWYSGYDLNLNSSKLPFRSLFLALKCYRTAAKSK
jgi:hypothetical protein